MQSSLYNPLFMQCVCPCDKMASLSFDFPDHLVIQFPSPEANAPQQATETPSIAHDWQLNDLQELSGEEEDDSHTDLPQQQAQSYPAAPRSHGASVMPDEVLLLVVDLLGLREVMGLACCCKAWHMCLLDSSAADGIWEQQERQLLAHGWPWPPFRGATPVVLPPSLGSTPRLHCKTTLSITQVALQYFVMRKGYEFMLAGFEELWGALEHAKTHPPAAAGAGVQAVSAAATSPPAAGSALDDHEQQHSCVPGGRQLQRLVDKLALHSWQLTYSGYSAALAARCAELAQQLRTAWQQQMQQQHCRTGGAAASPDISGTALASSSSAASEAAAAAAAAAGALAPAVLADCAGGILCDIEAVSGGLGAGELLAAEPELLLAATRRGGRPAASIALWVALLPVWECYRRWLDLVGARAGLLGARVAAARQLAEPTSRGPANAALLPHLRNKGLLLFRGHVLLSYGLRRPLQEAALWLAAAASADASSWRAGGGCSESDLELLTRLRKLLTELDVADGEDEEVRYHTHAKFRRCFGALLSRQRRSRCLPASAW